jgi:hypothetical protein
MQFTFESIEPGMTVRAIESARQYYVPCLNLQANIDRFSHRFYPRTTSLHVYHHLWVPEITM